MLINNYVQSTSKFYAPVHLYELHVDFTYQGTSIYVLNFLAIFLFCIDIDVCQISTGPMDLFLIGKDVSLCFVVVGFPYPDMRWFKKIGDQGRREIKDDDEHDIHVLISHSAQELSISEFW